MPRRQRPGCLAALLSVFKPSAKKLGAVLKKDHNFLSKRKYRR